MFTAVIFFWDQMNNSNRIFSGNICWFGVSNVGVPAAIVLAEMCPSLNIAVVDLNPENITLWDTKQIPIHEPGLEEMLTKCHNRNLVFTANTVDAIKMAEIIFMSLNSPMHSCINQKETRNLKDFEKASRLIAEVSNTNKIIVLKSTVPVGSNAAIKRILMANSMDNVRFQVLSIPEFFSTGNAVSSLLHPEKVLIGSDLTKEALWASEALASVYTQWIPRNRIKTMSSWSTELAKLSQNAFLAQRISSLNALSIICEEAGVDISDVAKMIADCSEIGPNYLEPSFGFGGSHLKNDLMCLKSMCESLNLFEMAEYWNQVLIINELQKKRFFHKILFSFFNTLTHKKFGIWGVAFKKNAVTSKDSVTVELCLKLFEEGAKLAFYDPKIERRQLVEELKMAGLIDELKAAELMEFSNMPSDTSDVVFCDDPYKAAFKADAIIVGTDLEEFKNLDYKLIYRDMTKPAFIFDGRKCLPHEELIQIGFFVETIGKKFSSEIPHINKKFI